MTRQCLSTKARVELFKRHSGRCHICSLRIDAGQEWEVSHPIPLELGGPDDDTNRAPAHKRCHRQHTATVDVPAISKAKRREAAHLGARAPSRTPLPGSRRSALKRKMNGQVVLRSPPSHYH
jgi:5-methylcytosine-specific restriction protein A